ncbi:RNA-binding protein 8A [Trypanosoma rangeli]|uniref:RNA-binding protein 8A n=1 Tax=Trypanosoma rangeli TaxID=5698 RepID=A0A3R7NI30_TRYRA|nr:RNA-binding protein 8A [Trypanosoma rangeli]RNF06866.1 RNA-binding protein 8A [Trypanosoma rangeli]|eukprot:RNF06866.1 RNA-binding protein 8A [Trypanosoma rangeli]
MIVEDTAAAEVPTVRRVRRMRMHFERLVRPSDVQPGDSMPSIEGWVLFLTNLPANTTTDHILDLFLTHKNERGEGCAPVREVRLPLDKDCCCRGYALVELERREAFERALQELNGVVLPFAEGEPPTGEDVWRLQIAPTFLGEEDDDDIPLAGEKRTLESIE